MTDSTPPAETTDPVPETHRSGAASGRPIVLVRGLAPAMSDEDRFAERLGERHPVVAIDLPGFGDSPRLTGVVTVERLADQVQRALDALDLEDPMLVGETLGASVVAEVAARRPELNDVVLIAPGTAADARTVSETIVRLTSSLRYEPARVRWTAFVAFLLSGWHIVRLIVRSIGFDIGLRAPSIGARVLLIRGEHDRVVPRSALRALARALPYGVIREIVGCGHWTTASRPAAVADLTLAFADGAVRDRGVASLQRVVDQEPVPELDRLSVAEAWAVLRDRTRARFARPAMGPGVDGAAVAGDGLPGTADVAAPDVDADGAPLVPDVDAAVPGAPGRGAVVPGPAVPGPAVPGLISRTGSARADRPS